MITTQPELNSVMADFQATIATMTKTWHTFSPPLPGAPFIPGPPGKPFRKRERYLHSDLLRIRRKAYKESAQIRDTQVTHIPTRVTRFSVFARLSLQRHRHTLK